MNKAFHGGAFWNQINPDFSSLEKSQDVISADVLDAWFDPSPKVVAKLSQFLTFGLKTSPPTHSKGLIGAISKNRGIPIECILVGGGSSDLMFALFPNVMSSKDKVLILDPMYGEYAHIFEKVIGLNLIRHQLDVEAEFTIDEEALHQHIESEQPQFVVLVNPNSPTGKYWEKEKLLKLIGAFPQITFVVDETYIEYVGKECSVEQATLENKNLIVIKSMSKMYALSGARVGYLVACPEKIEAISKFIPPWSVGLLGQIAGVTALDDEAYYEGKWEETHRLRAEMIRDLDKVHLKAFDSVGNFFLVQVPKTLSASSLIEALRVQGIYLRNCDSMSTQFQDDFVRIGVKEASVNRRIVNALNTFIGGSQL